MSSTSDGCTFPKLLAGLLNSPLLINNTYIYILNNKIAALSIYAKNKSVNIRLKEFHFLLSTLGTPIFIWTLHFGPCFRRLLFFLSGVCWIYMQLTLVLSLNIFGLTSSKLQKHKLKCITPTFLALTGSGIIVCALNLLFLQISFKPSQVCVKTPDVFVNLEKRRWKVAII